MSHVAHPMADPFRRALRGLAASVTIVSTRAGGIRYGMVATAVMSLSMEPPSLAVAVNASASIHGPILRRRAFVVNVLGAGNEHLARGFAEASGEARFAHGAWSTHHPDASDALPFLASGQASVFCDVVDAHRSGSHTLFVGAVRDVADGRGRSPLMYCDGRYGAFAVLPSLAATG